MFTFRQVFWSNKHFHDSKMSCLTAGFFFFKYTFNNNCIARMENLSGKQVFYIPALLQLATRGHCFTPTPEQVNLKRMQALFTAVWWKPTEPWLISFYLQKKKIHSAYKKYMLHYSLLTYNLSLGFCRLLHLSAVELVVCVDVYNMALQLLIWSMIHAHMRKLFNELTANASNAILNIQLVLGHKNEMTVKISVKIS